MVICEFLLQNSFMLFIFVTKFFYVIYITHREIKFEAG
jgi:hypothetical protein